MFGKKPMMASASPDQRWSLLCAAESERVKPEAHLPSSNTDTEQENTNTDIQYALMANIP